MQKMQNNSQYQVYRIVICAYSAFLLKMCTPHFADGTRCIFCTIYCTQPPHTEVTKLRLLCPHHEGAGAPHPIRVGGSDLWYQMALVDTTVKQSLASSAGGDERVCEMCG